MGDELEKLGGERSEPRMLRAERNGGEEILLKRGRRTR